VTVGGPLASHNEWVTGRRSAQLVPPITNVTIFFLFIDTHLQPPVEPLRQYMTPRHKGGPTVFAPDSPEGDDGDNTFFEYQNPGKGKSAAVGPLSSARSSGSRKARASAAATVSPANAMAAAAAAAGLMAAATPPRRKGEEK